MHYSLLASLTNNKNSDATKCRKKTAIKTGVFRPVLYTAVESHLCGSIVVELFLLQN